jgi:GT2 family glycosyltransferase
MLAILRRHRRAGIVGNVQFRAATGALDHIGFQVGLTGKPYHDESRRWLWAPWGSRAAAAVTAACLLVPRDLFLQLRGFDEGFRNGGEDVDLCFRARALGYTCHVALHSRIRHHVSASPGRKLRDEENSRRLAHRWHEEFLRLNRRLHGLQWCAERFHEDPRDLDRKQAAAIALFLLGLRPYPSDAVIRRQEAALRREESHWRELLGPLPAGDFVSSLPSVDATPSPLATPGAALPAAHLV